LGSTGSLSSTITPKTASCTRRNGSLRTNLSRGLHVPVMRFVGMNFSFRGQQMKRGELVVVYILHRPAITVVGGNKILSHRSARGSLSKQFAHVEAAPGCLLKCGNFIGERRPRGCAYGGILLLQQFLRFG